MWISSSAAATTLPLPRTHDRIPEAESVPAADWLTSAAALLRCYTDLCRPEQERHDQLRRRAQNGAQSISRWLVASRGHEHACTIALLPVLQLLYILQCPTAVPRVTHVPMLLGIFHSAAASRCACVAQVARTACVAQVARTIAVEENALLDDGSADRTTVPLNGALSQVLPNGALSQVLPKGALRVHAHEQAPALPEQVSVPVPLVDGSHPTSSRVGEHDALSQPAEMSSTSPDLPAASARLAVDSSRSAAERHAAPKQADATRAALQAAEAAWAVEAEARRVAERREAEAVAAAREKDAEWQQHHTYLKLGERQREADRVAKQCGGTSTVSSVR